MTELPKVCQEDQNSLDLLVLLSAALKYPNIWATIANIKVLCSDCLVQLLT